MAINDSWLQMDYRWDDEPEDTSYGQKDRPENSWLTEDYAWEGEQSYETPNVTTDTGIIQKTIGAGKRGSYEAGKMVGRFLEAPGTVLGLDYDLPIDDWFENLKQTDEGAAYTLDQYDDMMSGEGIGMGYQAIESIPSSLALMAPYIFGPVVGSVVSFSMYGGSTAKQKFDEQIANGTPEALAREHALMQGTSGGTINTLANVLEVGLMSKLPGAKLLSPLFKTKAIKNFSDIYKRSPAQLGADAVEAYTKMATTEVSTEVSEALIENKLAQHYGFTDENMSSEELKELIGVTMLASGAFSLIGGGMQLNSMNKMKKLLADTSSPTRQAAVAEKVRKELVVKGFEDEAKVWDEYAELRIARGEPITIEQDMETAGAAVAQYHEEARFEKAGETATERAKNRGTTPLGVATRIATAPIEETEGTVTEALGNKGIDVPTPTSTGIDPGTEAKAGEDPNVPGPNETATIAVQGGIAGAGTGAAADIPTGPVPGAGVMPPSSRAPATTVPRDAAGTAYVQAPVSQAPVSPETPQVPPSTIRANAPGTAAPVIPSRPEPRGAAGTTGMPVAPPDVAQVAPGGANVPAPMPGPAQAPTSPTAATGTPLAPATPKPLEIEEIQEAIFRLQDSQGQNAEPLSPEEKIEIDQILKQARVEGWDVDQGLAYEPGGPTVAETAVAESASSPAITEVALGNVEDPKVKELIADKLFDIPKNDTDGNNVPLADRVAEAVDAVVEEIDDPVLKEQVGKQKQAIMETYQEGARDKRTAGILWSRDAAGDFYQGVDVEGQRYWITKKGKGQWILTKGNEEIGIFKTPRDARDSFVQGKKVKLGGTKEAKAATEAKVAEARKEKLEGYDKTGSNKNFRATLKGEVINKDLAIRQAARVVMFQELHAKDPGLSVTATVRKLNAFGSNKDARAWTDKVLAGDAKTPGAQTITEKVKGDSIQKKAAAVKAAEPKTAAPKATKPKKPSATQRAKEAAAILKAEAPKAAKAAKAKAAKEAKAKAAKEAKAAKDKAAKEAKAETQEEKRRVAIANETAPNVLDRIYKHLRMLPVLEAYTTEFRRRDVNESILAARMRDIRAMATELGVEMGLPESEAKWMGDYVGHYAETEITSSRTYDPLTRPVNTQKPRPTLPANGETERHNVGSNNLMYFKSMEDKMVNWAKAVMGNLHNFRGNEMIIVGKLQLLEWKGMTVQQRQNSGITTLGQIALDDVAAKAVNFGSSLQGRATSYAYDGVSVVYIKSPTLNKPAVATVGHEIGHVYMYDRFVRLPSAQRRIMYNQWKKDHKNMLGSDPMIDYKDFMLMTRNILSSELYTGNSGTLRGQQLHPDRHDLYMTSFEEWFADQISKYMTTDAKPVGELQQFFADMAMYLKSMADAILGTDFMPNDVIKAFVQGRDWQGVAVGHEKVVTKEAKAAWDESTFAQGVAEELGQEGLGYTQSKDVPAELKVEAPKTTKGGLTMVSKDKSILKRAMLFKNLLSSFGINSPKIFVVEMGDLDNNFAERYNAVPEWVQDAMIGMREKGDVMNAYAATDYNPDTNEAYVFIGKARQDTKSKQGQYDIMAHEAGHVLERVFFHGAPQKTKDAIIKSWKKFVSETYDPNMTVGELLRQTRTQELGTRVNPEIANKKVSELSANELVYFSGFEEWFANETAKWAGSTQAPKGPIEEFFKGMYDRFKKLVAQIQGQGDTWYDLPDAEVAKFLNERAAVAKMARDQGIKYAPEKSGVIDSELHEDYRWDMTEATAKLVLNEEQVADMGMSPGQAKYYTDQQKAKAALGGKILYGTKEAADIIRADIAAGKGLMPTLGRIGTRVGDVMSKYFESGTDAMGRIDKGLQRILNGIGFRVNKINEEYKARIQPFATAIEAMPEDQQRLLGIMLGSGNRKKAVSHFGKNSAVIKALDEVDKVNEEIQKRAEKAGLKVEKSEKYYFPRRVKDLPGLMNYIDKTMEGAEGDPGTKARIDLEIEAAQRTAKELGIDFTVAHREEIISQYLQSGQYYGALRKPGAMKDRTVGAIDPHMAKFYENPLQAMHQHMMEMNDSIEVQSAFGTGTRKKMIRKYNSDVKKLAGMKTTNKNYADLATQVGEERARLMNPRDDMVLDESINSLLSRNGLKGEAKDKALAIFRARAQQVGMGKNASIFREMGLLSTLANPLSAITQIGEIGLNVFQNKGSSFNGLFKAAGGKSYIDAQVLGLVNSTMEYESGNSPLSKVLTAGLRWSGFQKADVKMKEAFMNSAIHRAQKLVNGSDKQKQEHRDKWEPYFGKESYNKLVKQLGKPGEMVMKDIKIQGRKGKAVTVSVPGEMVQEMAWAEQMKYQPLDVAANSRAYMLGGNARLMYMLKTFNLRQLNRIYTMLAEDLKGFNSATGKEKAVKAKAAMTRAMGMSILLALGGAGTDELREFFLGRDSSFKDKMSDNLWNIILLNRYAVQSIEKEGLGSVVAGMALPAMPWLDNPSKDLWNLLDSGDPSYKTLQAFPLVGRLLYDYTPVGRTNEVNARKGDLRKAITKDIMKDGRVSGKTRDSIREYNSGRTGTERLNASNVSRTISTARKAKREAN